MAEEVAVSAPVKPKTFAEALLAAQKDMPAVQPDSENPHFRSKFVSLGHLIAKVRPVLNKHGLAFTQYPSRDEDGTPTLVTILMHESGEQMESTAPLLLPKQDPQGQGSAITYMRRYALASVLGISDQEDDDGNGAAGAKGKPKDTSRDSSSKKDAPPREGSNIPSTDQLALLVKLLKERNVSQANQDLVRDWAAVHLTGGRGGTMSEALEALMKGTPEVQMDTYRGLAEKAGQWAASQTDLPADTEGLPIP